MKTSCITCILVHYVYWPIILLVLRSGIGCVCATQPTKPVSPLRMAAYLSQRCDSNPPPSTTNNLGHLLWLINVVITHALQKEHRANILELHTIHSPLKLNLLPSCSSIVTSFFLTAKNKVWSCTRKAKLAFSGIVIIWPCKLAVQEGNTEWLLLFGT